MTDDTFLSTLLILSLCLLVLGFYFFQATERGEVVMGMTSASVLRAWGEPDHISTREVRKEGSFIANLFSITRETWTYIDPARIVIFEDGFVAEIGY